MIIVTVFAGCGIDCHATDRIHDGRMPNDGGIAMGVIAVMIRMIMTAAAAASGLASRRCWDRRRPWTNNRIRNPFCRCRNLLFRMRSSRSPMPLATHTLWGYIERMRKDIKTSCQKRLSRIEGQVRGLAKMVEEDRYCIDIVTQISAVRAALRRVEEEILKVTSRTVSNMRLRAATRPISAGRSRN